MKNVYILIAFLSVLSTKVVAQKQITATIVDETTQETIPFATIELNKKSGVVSNSEGKFQLYLKNNPSVKDSLHINFLGYEPKNIPVLSFKDSMITLTPKSFELDEVIVLNKNYTIEEIIAKASESLDQNYAPDFIKSKLFFRESNVTDLTKNDVNVKKTSIPELNQKFIDSILTFIPKKDEIHTEILADYYTTPNEDDKNKLDIIKACRLYDDKSSVSFENIEEKLNKILKTHIKRDSYFKIKSGLFGTKQDIDSTFFEDGNKEETEKMLAEKEKREEEKKKSFLKQSASSILYLKQKNIVNEDSKLNFIIKPKKYIYELLGVISMNDNFVYKIGFEPKSSADYKGRLYINTSDFAVVRADFENVKNVKNFNLLGISFSQNIHKGTLIYGKNNKDRYLLKFAEDIAGIRFGINRPLKIIEKNKNVKGRRKQNEIATKVHFKLTTLTKKELAVFENSVIDESVFGGFKENASVSPTELKKYDPNFWKGNTIVEPNQAIKDFKSLE